MSCTPLLSSRILGFFPSGSGFFSSKPSGPTVTKSSTVLNWHRIWVYFEWQSCLIHCVLQLCHGHYVVIRTSRAHILGQTSNTGRVLVKQSLSKWYPPSSIFGLTSQTNHIAWSNNSQSFYNSNVLAYFLFLKCVQQFFLLGFGCFFMILLILYFLLICKKRQFL